VRNRRKAATHAAITARSTTNFIVVSVPTSSRARDPLSRSAPARRSADARCVDALDGPAAVGLLLCGCSTDEPAARSSSSAAASPSGGFESTSIVLTQFFVGLAGGDHEAVAAVICPSTLDVDELLSEHREGVREAGPIRLRLATVDQSASAGRVSFEATTNDSVVPLVAILDADGGNGICLAAITSEDGATPPVLPVWVDEQRQIYLWFVGD
jgi:hypothetical protein